MGSFTKLLQLKLIKYSPNMCVSTWVSTLNLLVSLVGLTNKFLR
jgi:hypothetical protein